VSSPRESGRRGRGRPRRLPSEITACSVEGCGREVKAKKMCHRHYSRLRRTGKLTTTRKTGSFWEKVDKGAKNECWPWTGYVRISGHGATTYKSFGILASRKAWILTYGPISSGLCVNHRCDNKLCCNPSHMYLGTRSDNMIDRWEDADPATRAPRGRPHVVTNAGLERLWEMRKNGATRKECAAAFNVHVATIARYIETWRKGAVDRLHAARLTQSQK
jgi:hypothetical protein